MSYLTYKGAPYIYWKEKEKYDIPPWISAEDCFVLVSYTWVWVCVCGEQGQSILLVSVIASCLAAASTAEWQLVLSTDSLLCLLTAGTTKWQLILSSDSWYCRLTVDTAEWQLALPSDSWHSLTETNHEINMHNINIQLFRAPLQCNQI